MAKGTDNKTDLHALEGNQQGAAENKTADLKSRPNRNEPGEKQKGKQKQYKNGEMSEWTPETMNVNLTDSNPGLHLSSTQ